MGRGAGNTKTEELLHELKEKTNKSSKFNYEIIYKLIFSHFKKLKLKYDWGSNQFYFLSAKNQIHPTYVQNMLDDTRYSDEDILSGINLLKNLTQKNMILIFLIMQSIIYQLRIKKKIIFKKNF